MNNYDYYNNVGDLESSLLGGIFVALMIVLVITLAIMIVQLIAYWKIYKKAGKGGWEAIVPFYCNWIIVKIAGLKWYWFLFFFAPLVSSFANLEILGWLAYLFGTFNCFYNISKRFNKGLGFAICFTLFTPICAAILGFSKKAIYDKNIPVSPNGVFGTPVSTQDNTNTETQQSVDQNNQKNLFCANCGSALMPNAKFCTKCGKRL